ncbi:MAG: iron ABC transporter permease, partial [Helicobacter sp.]|nr:iron ABC transporter permease [Helicobacter sp.]
MSYSLNLLKIGAILLALFLSLPLLSIFTELLYVIFQNFSTQNSTEILAIKENLNHFFSYLFIKFIKDTFLVLLGVLSLSLIIGVS